VTGPLRKVVVVTWPVRGGGVDVCDVVARRRWRWSSWSTCRLSLTFASTHPLLLFPLNRAHSILDVQWFGHSHSSLLVGSPTPSFAYMS
jgi:hypothetical protein